MATLTPTQLNYLRTEQFRAKFYLSVSQPDTLLTAVVDGAHAQGATSLDYTSGTGSGYSNIAAGQTLQVVTAYGTEYARIKSVTGSQSAGTLTLAANSIVWGDGQDITVLEEYQLRPLLNIISPKSSAGVFYKDTTITYSAQNTDTSPVVIAGPHRVGYISAGSLDFTVDLTDSYATADGASISSTSLTTSAAGGLGITDNGDDTYDISVTTAGQYWLKATVTDSNGTAQSSYRRVFAYDANNAPFTDLDINTLSGDWQRGGWTMNATLNSDATTASVRDQTLVVLWMQQGNTAVGGTTGGENILFAGYVQADSIQNDWDAGTVRFSANTVHQRLNELAIYDLSLAAVTTPQYWYEYGLNLTTALAVHHLFKWHSTLFEIADVYGLTDDTILRKYAEVPAGSIGQMGRKLAQQRQAKMVCNSAGQMYWQLDAQMLNAGDRAALPDIFTTTTADSIGARTISATTPKLSSANVSALSFNGATISAHCAIAPMADVLAPGSGQTGISDACVSGATHAAELAGRLLAAGNNIYPEVRLQYPGNYAKIFDIAPAEWTRMDVASGDTPRGIVWDSKRLLPRRVTLRLQPPTGGLTVDVNYDTEAIGPDGVSVDCPTGYSLSDSTARDAPSWDTPRDAADSYALIAFGDNGTYLRLDTASDWDERNGDLGAGVTAANYGIVDPWWWTPGKNASNNPEAAILMRTTDDYGLFYSLDCGSNWPYEITPVSDPPNSWSDGTAPTLADLTITQLCPNYFNNGQFFALAEYDTGSAWRGWLLQSDDNGLSWSYNPIFTGTAPTESKPIWGMVDQGSGTILWLTVFRDDNLYLQKWTISTMTFTETDLGAATTAEMEAETYTAAPFAVFGDVDTIYVYGRMDAPASLSAGTYAVIKSTNGATSFSSIESGWSADRCAAFYADDSDNLYAVRATP